jgi:cytochrome b561
MNSAKTIRGIVGFLILMAILLRGNAIMNYIEAHPWVGVVLLFCAVAYILWGMFRKQNKA